MDKKERKSKEERRQSNKFSEEGLLQHNEDLRKDLPSDQGEVAGAMNNTQDEEQVQIVTRQNSAEEDAADDHLKWSFNSKDQNKIGGGGEYNTRNADQLPHENSPE